jgi:hypothetical protein
MRKEIFMQNIVENKTEDFLQEYSKLEGLLKKVNDVPDTVCLTRACLLSLCAFES